MPSFRQRLRETFRKTDNAEPIPNQGSTAVESDHPSLRSGNDLDQSRRSSSFNESRSIDETFSEEFHFIVDYIGSANISEAQSVQLLLETIKRVKKQQLRTIRVDFVIREGMLKVNSVDTNGSILTAPLYAVAQCAQEQVRGFDHCYGLNITRKSNHMCHVFQAGSHLEAGSIVRSVALSFKMIGRMLREKREKQRQARSTSVSSSDRTRTNSEVSTSTIEEALRETRRRQSLLRHTGDRDSSLGSGGRKSPHSYKHSRSFSKSSTSPSILRHPLCIHPSSRHVEFSALSPVPSDSSDNEGRSSVKYSLPEVVEAHETRPESIQVEVEVYSSPKPTVQPECLEEKLGAIALEDKKDMESPMPDVDSIAGVNNPSDIVPPEKPIEAPSTPKEKDPASVRLPETSIQSSSIPVESEPLSEEEKAFQIAVDAIASGDIAGLEMILDEGLFIDASDHMQRSLIYHAVTFGQADIVQFLLKRGAEVNWEGPEDRTPLHVAAAEGNRTITQMLLAFGANVRAKDSAFCTPLHLSVGKLQNLEVSHLLVEHGARILENNIQGVRPVDLEMQLKEMQRLLVQSACEAFYSTDLSKSRSNSGTSSCAHAPHAASIRSPRVCPSDSLRRGYRSSSLCSLSRGLVRASPETIKGVGSLRRSESIHMSRTLSPLLARGKRSGLRRSQSFQKYPRDLKFEQELRERMEVNMKSKQDENDEALETKEPESETTAKQSVFEVPPLHMSRQRSNSDLARYTSVKIPAEERKEIKMELEKFVDSLADEPPMRVSLKEFPDTPDSTTHRPPSPSSLLLEGPQRPRNHRQHSTESETSAGAPRSASECEDSSFLSTGSHYSKEDEHVIESLKSVVLLSGNPECHESLLAYLCLPKATAQFVCLSHMPGMLPTVAENIAVLIGNLFNLEGPESRKRSVEAGLIKTVLKLVDGAEPIQNTCLSILHNILDYDNDREYSTALKNVPLEPLLNLLHCNDTDSGAFDVRNSESPPPYPSAERGRRCKTSTCSRDSHDEREARHRIREPSPVCGGSVQRNNSGSSEVWAERRRMFQKRNSISSMASSVEGDQNYSVFSPAYSHGHLPWSSFGPDMHTKNPKLVATKMLAATSMNPKIQKELGKSRPLSLLLETLLDLNQDIVLHTVAALANVAMDLENHLQIETSGAVEAFKRLLLHHEKRISYHAARGLVYLGGVDVGDVYLFNQISGDDKLDVIFADINDAEGTGTGALFVRGATVEKIVEIVTKNPSILWGGTRLSSSPKGYRASERKVNGNGSPFGKQLVTEDQIMDFILTMQKSFVHGVILMRLLIHRFRNPFFKKYFDGDPSTGQIQQNDPLPVVHIQLMRLWKMWLERYPEAFVENPLIANELSTLLLPMRRAGGPYLPCAESLEHYLTSIVDMNPVKRTLESSHENHCHHSILYEQCQKAVVGGGLPCHVEDAIYLSALQLYIEDMSPPSAETRGRLEGWFLQGTGSEKLSASRLKQAVHPSFYKVKNIAKRIRGQREHFQNEGLSERNAKHNYIDCCQAMPGYGCRFFQLKECLGTISRNSGHVDRLFGISPKKVVLLDERTKGVVGNWQFNDVKRWKLVAGDTRLRVELVNMAFEFTMENKSTFKEISDLLFYSTRSNFQTLREHDFSPWSKYAEETETWGEVALAAQTSHGLPQPRDDDSPLGDPSRMRAVSCVASSVPGPRPFQRGTSLVEQLSTSAPYQQCAMGSLPMAPQPTRMAPVLAATAGGSSLIAGSSVQSSKFGSPSTIHSSEEHLLGSYQSSCSSSLRNPSAASKWSWDLSTAHPDMSLRTRHPSRSSEDSIENSPTELHPLDPSTSPNKPSRRQRFHSSDSTSSLGSPQESHALPTGQSPTRPHSGLLWPEPDYETENTNRMFGLSPKGQLLNCRCPPEAELPGFDRRNFTAYDLLFHPKELARQITLLDHEFFCAVTSDDIQKKIAMGTGRRKNLDSQPRLLCERVADRFNQLSTWVVASILTEESVEKRAQMFINFIETAKQCLKLRNFNAVMAIVVAALGSSSIRRLARTKQLVPKEFLEQCAKIEMLMDTKNNYKKYRTTLRASPTPAVPYFGIYMKDLTFIAEGNPDFLKGGLVNISKRRQVYIVINEIRQFQKKSYHFQEVAEVREYLLSQELVSEGDLHLVSCQLEPPLTRRHSETDKPTEPSTVPKLTRSNTLSRVGGKTCLVLKEAAAVNTDSNC
ncbi:uncharacterized protein LOC5521422 isoform X1 [Nematostella vectensis]|uniref:uncharacterized protein LOC5521422 isoform X1 n=1 Tax=Nematostella vectensis TaxID=45351 RepID=UPI0020770BE6|nr:uncharacterized protein LOC5521422 isoform X1 [Nematostella vectensis]